MFVREPSFTNPVDMKQFSGSHQIMDMSGSIQKMVLQTGSEVFRFIQFQGAFNNGQKQKTRRLVVNARPHRRFSHWK